MRSETDNYICDKPDDFGFFLFSVHVVIYIFSPAYGVYISQLFRYARASFAYEDFSKLCRLLTEKLTLEGYMYNQSC
jgi:hypothetical protein